MSNRTPITAYRCERRTYGQRDDEELHPGIMLVYYGLSEENVIESTPQMVDFLCPCGCGNSCPTHVIPLAEKRGDVKGVWKNHCWGFDPDTVTLFPSVRFTSGCKAHFNITNGKVIMHADSGK